MNDTGTRRLALAALGIGLGGIAFRVARDWLVGGAPPLWIKLMGSVAVILIFGSSIVLRTVSNK